MSEDSDKKERAEKGEGWRARRDYGEGRVHASGH